MKLKRWIDAQATIRKLRDDNAALRTQVELLDKWFNQAMDAKVEADLELSEVSKKLAETMKENRTLHDAGKAMHDSLTKARDQRESCRKELLLMKQQRDAAFEILEEVRG